MIVPLLFLAGCFGSPRVPSAPDAKEVPASLGDFLQQWGIWLIPIGIIALIISVAARRWVGGDIAKTIASGGAAAVVIGIALYYGGPWVGVATLGAVILLVGFATLLFIRNKNRYVRQLESALNSDIDGDTIVGEPARDHA